ncbi:exporter of polyketide antibiotics [Aeromicrobium panaciterrae]|uniref:ABC transporter permease n=1 Tax=Aeromicrobium panaciterrae TaxID=363861 RepID=UPI0031DC0C3C
MTGVRTLLRLYLRRDRIMLPAWILGGMLLYFSQAVSTDGLYTTQAELDKAAKSIGGNAAFIAMLGPDRALNTLGGQVAWQSVAFGIIVAGLMSMFIVGRHTRAEEETGRDELIRSAVVDRSAPMVAAAIVAIGANVLLGALTTLSLLTVGLDVAGCVSLGASLALGGIVFAGVALLTAQLTEGVRTMYGITGAVIGVSYVLRAVGDVGNGALSWLSPIGWAQGMRAFAGEEWWPIVLFVIGAGVPIAAAIWIFGRRDVGSGVFAARPGPARAGRGLTSSTGLAWRLQRGTIVGWAVGLLLMGLSYGSIGNDVEDLIGDSEFSKDVFGAGAGPSLTESFYATAIGMIALLACGLVISSALRPRAEDEAGRVEGLLATALPRSRWLLGHVTMTVLSAVGGVLLGGLGLGLGYALVTGDGGAVRTYFVATVPYIAPVLLLAGLARLLYGISSRLAPFAWAALGFCFIVLMFGAVLQLPDWITAVSPFDHLALTPAEDARWTPVVVIGALAAATSAAGQLLFRRRDVH